MLKICFLCKLIVRVNFSNATYLNSNCVSLTNDRPKCSGLLLLSTFFVSCWAYYMRYRHLSLSVRRKITANVFYSTFTNVFFIFVTVLKRFLTFFLFFLGGERFFSSMGEGEIRNNVRV